MYVDTVSLSTWDSEELIYFEIERNVFIIAQVSLESSTMKFLLLPSSSHLLPVSHIVTVSKATMPATGLFKTLTMLFTAAEKILRYSQSVYCHTATRLPWLSALSPPAPALSADIKLCNPGDSGLCKCKLQPILAQTHRKICWENQKFQHFIFIQSIQKT